MRTIVDLPDRQIEALKRMPDAVQLSRAELMRRAVAEYLARHQPMEKDEAFGVWKARNVGHTKYKRFSGG